MRLALAAWMVATEAAAYQLDTLRLRPVKIGGRVLTVTS